jgi:hypothetical protein
LKDKSNLRFWVLGSRLKDKSNLRFRVQGSRFKGSRVHTDNPERGTLNLEPLRVQRLKNED